MNEGMKEDEFDMTNSEQLVQRFVDQELSADERVRFIARLGRDGALRQRAIDLEQLVLDTSRLPRPVVSDRFVASVMERTASTPSIWRQLADTLWAPRDLRWNLASAVACLAVLVVGGVIAGRLAFPPARPGSAPGAGAASAPVDASTVLVRLVILQPNAKTVQVAGDFNGWNPARTSLEHISEGAWAVTIPLKPGRYEYMFVVDGQQWIADPFAAEQSDDGFGSRNAVLEVRPPSGAQS
jgi:AMP-activated protein kinase-like protein